MSLILPKESGGDFELPPADTHVAVCYRIVDLGTQQSEYMGVAKRQHKIMLSWELPEAKMKDGRPFSMHQRYTFSASGKSTFRKHIESWRGVPFTDADFGKLDIGVLLGKPCLLGVVHHHADNGSTYANISSIMRLPKGMPSPALENETIYFSLSGFDQGVFDKLSEGLKAIIAKSPEYQQLKGAHRVEQEIGDGDYSYGAKQPFDDSEIPF